MRQPSAAAVLALAAVLSACGSSPPPSPATDAGVRDAAEADAERPACTTDRECNDGTFCNGVERCADEGLCVAGAAPCAGTCLEDDERCGECDVDDDGSLATGCGGDDCDDSDASRSPTATEVCDAADVDEDCDPTTFGERDLDDDGYADDACCNVTGEGVRACGDDCDDAMPGIHPTEAEMCNRVDEDCDGTVDEGACSFAVAVASDTGHACAVGSLGYVWCWGDNEYGQLGDGTTTPRTTGARVTGLVDAVEVDVDGIGYSCARTRGGDVRCWGGDDTCRADEPVDVFTGMDVIDIDVWYNDLCALTADGRTLCVYFDYLCETVPSERCGTGPTDARELAIGGDFCCWRRAGGQVQCAGDNGVGELGDGTNTSRSTAAPVSGLGDAISIDAGASSACAVRATGEVVCWGANDFGQLGRDTGALEMATTPGRVGALASGASLVSVRTANACAVVSGAMWCWGRDWGTEPIRLADADVTHASAGIGDYCFVRDGDVYCRDASSAFARVGGIP